MVPELRTHKAELLELLSATVKVEIPEPRVACEMYVPRSRVIDFMTEAKRRGLIVRYRVEGSDTASTVMPGPGQTADDLRESLRQEFGHLVEVEP